MARGHAACHWSPATICSTCTSPASKAASASNCAWQQIRRLGHCPPIHTRASKTDTHRKEKGERETERDRERADGGERGGEGEGAKEGGREGGKEEGREGGREGETEEGRTTREARRRGRA